MNKEEALEVVDFSLQLVDEWPISYQQLKSEIKAYIIINMFYNYKYNSIKRII